MGLTKQARLKMQMADKEMKSRNLDEFEGVAFNHIKDYQKKMYKALLKKPGALQEVIRDRAEQAARVWDQMLANGFQEWETHDQVNEILRPALSE